ncbi:uncharacterized protein LOC144115649 [Amblyomma americanum]
MKDVRPLEPGGSAAAAQRKRFHQSSEASSQATVLHSATSEDSLAGDGFVLVMSKKAKRRLRKSEDSSSSSTSAVITTRGAPAHTVLFTPETPIDNFNLLNRQATSVFLEARVPGVIKDVRIKSRRNLLAIDVTERSALESLATIKKIGDIPVRSLVLEDNGTTAGGIYDIDANIPDSDLPILIKPATNSIEITKVQRLGKSSSTHQPPPPARGYPPPPWVHLPIPPLPTFTLQKFHPPQVLLLEAHTAAE